MPWCLGAGPATPVKWCRRETPISDPLGSAGCQEWCARRKPSAPGPAKRTEAPALRQSGVRAASPPPSDDREPRTRKGVRPLSPRRSSVTSQATSQPRAQGTRWTKPARDSGSRVQVGSARERAGARRVPEPRSLGRSLCGRPNPQDVAPGDRSTNAGRVHRGDTASASASRVARASPGQLPDPAPAGQNQDSSLRTWGPQPPRLNVRVALFYRLIRPDSSGPGLRCPRRALSLPEASTRCAFSPPLKEKGRARPGFEPGTSRTQSENHPPRPTSQHTPPTPSPRPSAGDSREARRCSSVVSVCTCETRSVGS